MLGSDSSSIDSETSSSVSSEVLVEGPNGGAKSDSEESSVTCRYKRSELSCLDLYSGCGGMSTGLCLGASLAGVNLVTVCQSMNLDFLLIFLLRKRAHVSAYKRQKIVLFYLARNGRLI